MARVPDRSALRRPGLRSDPGLRVPAEGFGAGAGEALSIVGREVQARAEQSLARQAEARRQEEERRRQRTTPAREIWSFGPPPWHPGPDPDWSRPVPMPDRDPPWSGWSHCIQLEVGGPWYCTPKGKSLHLRPLSTEPASQASTPEAAAERLRLGATTAARRAQAAAGRREMTEAARQVLDSAEQPAAGLPAAVKAQAEAVLKSRLSQARKAGLGEDDLARLEADLGGHELLLLERGLVEQGTRLRAQAAAQLESEAGALVEAVQSNPARAADAAAALDELLADFAAGAEPARLEAFAGQARARLALAEVEGFLGGGDPDAAAEALGAAEALPEAARARLAQRIATERARLPEDRRALAERTRAEALAALEAGRGPDPETPARIADLAGPEALAGLEAEAETAARRRELAGQLSGQPPAAWEQALAEAETDPEERAAVLRLAAPLRRRVELDPRAAVAQRVEARISALLAQGQVRTPAQEAQARRFLAEAFQREAGIAAPRIFTNQERADWVEAYREAEPEARPALILAARSGAARSGAAPEGESAPPDEAALAELIAGLPADLRAEAEARAATIAELEEAGIDPASVDLTQADPDNLYGLRDPRLAAAPQLAQAGSDDAGGAAGEGAADPFRRREGETADVWVLRLQDELRAAEGAEARLPIYEAFLQALADDPAARGALAQGVGPEAHLTARPAPEHVQADYDRALASGELRADEGLPLALNLLYFIGPDGKLYQRGTEQDDSLLPAFSRQIELWMARDEVGQEGERRQALQLLLEEFGQTLLTRGRMPPTRRLGIGDGDQGGEGGPGASGGEGPGGGSDGTPAAGTSQEGRRPGSEGTLRLKRPVEDPAPPEVQRRPDPERDPKPAPPPDAATLIGRRIISEARPARQSPDKKVHIVRAQEEVVFGAQETRLHIGFDRSLTDRAGRRMNVETPLAAEVLETGRPLGLTDPETFGRFKAILREHKPDLPADARIAIRGSAITGDGFDKAKGRYELGYFDNDRVSDHDVGVVSETYFEQAQALGYETRQNGTRTVALKVEDLRALGGGQLLEDIRELTGRKDTTVMIYRSQDALNLRGPNITFDLR